MNVNSWKKQQPQHSAHQDAGLCAVALGTRDAHAGCVRVHAEERRVRGRVQRGGALAQTQQRIDWDPMLRIHWYEMDEASPVAGLLAEHLERGEREAHSADGDPAVAQVHGHGALARVLPSPAGQHVVVQPDAYTRVISLVTTISGQFVPANYGARGAPSAASVQRIFASIATYHRSGRWTCWSWKPIEDTRGGARGGSSRLVDDCPLDRTWSLQRADRDDRSGIWRSEPLETEALLFGRSLERQTFHASIEIAQFPRRTRH